MNIFEKLTDKSWEPVATGSARAKAAMVGPSSRLAMQKTALWIFIAIVSVLFILFFITFITHSQYPGFQALAGSPWAPLTNTAQLWLNTVLLAASSLAIHLALIASRRNLPNATIVAMLVAAFFAIQFVLAQLWLWRQLSGMGYSLTSNPANSYFYMLTAIHGFHLLGGLVVLLRASVLFWHGVATERIRASLELCTTYWHYLFALWVVLFALLASSPETYKTIAAICGLGG
jgi:cytochrome c oxidase subunit 3